MILLVILEDVLAGKLHLQAVYENGYFIDVQPVRAVASSADNYARFGSGINPASERNADEIINDRNRFSVFTDNDKLIRASSRNGPVKIINDSPLTISASAPGLDPQLFLTSDRFTKAHCAKYFRSGRGYPNAAREDVGA
ncbi:unnamed protein product [Anisakis simplex]|uniref:DUF1559 domain-containing protein n=1 Tax=Anisakis simplex TaxID=6269 RepID=A0A0M3J9H3_ANISI|nr:unnamed protein product [Anisakis simplex]